MKRFKVEVEDGHILRLYYPDLSVAREHYQNAKIADDNDQSHVAYIKQMLDSAVDCKIVERNGSAVYLLRIITPVGICVAQLFQDKTDGAWYDFCKCRLWKTGALIFPIGWNILNPAGFCKRYLFSSMEYAVISSGANNRKPKELCGIKKFVSVPFGKCKCQLFLRGDDLYINHNDYFSQSWRPPADDIGKPTSYYLKKYFGVTKTEKFVYADCWGGIVLRSKAWLRITNFAKVVGILNAPQIAMTIWPMIRQYHGWSESEQNMDWERFLMEVANKTKEYLRLANQSIAL